MSSFLMERTPLQESLAPPLPLLDEGDLLKALRQAAPADSLEVEKLSQVLRDAREQMLVRAKKNLQQADYKNETCALAIAAATDFLIISLFNFLHEKITFNAKKKDTLTLIAVGGYGARRLAPFSDIDLLFLLPRGAGGEQADKRAQWIEVLLKILWGGGFKLGYSVRDIKNIAKTAKENMVFMTALLDARFLSGASEQFDALQKQIVRTKKTITPRRFVRAKLDERDYRHNREGKYRFLVEPNIKNSKGGLRDLQTLWWLAQFCDESYESIFTHEEYDTLRQCEGFLWEVRCRLHFLCQGAQEKLNFQHQPALAEKMGFSGKGQVSVEAFMKLYFLTAREAGNLTRILCAQLESDQAKPQPRMDALMKRIKSADNRYIKLARRFVLEKGRLNIEQVDIFITNPVNMLRYFDLAAEYNLNFHPNALKEIKKAVLVAPISLRENALANKLFLSILTSHKDPARILRAMNETSLLGWFIPDFGKIVAQMQFNRYHHYTVDEHLLHAIEQLSQLEQKGLDELKRVRKVAAQIKPSRAVLYLALLTHDISKGDEGDHSELGALVCKKLAKRVGFSPEDRALAAWLVENHLLMSDVAQKRDLSDSKTIRNFVRSVETPKRLNLLFLLTIADILAVGPGTWNGWKAQLLGRLYELALTELKTPSHFKQAKVARQVRRRLADELNWPERTKRNYLKGLSDAYWSNTTAATQKDHALLWKAWEEKTPFAFSFCDKPEQAVSEIVVITPDHPGLFSRIVSAIAVSETQITDVKIFTSSSGLAFDTFWVQTHNQTPLGKEHSARLKENIHNVLTASLLPHKEIQQRQGAGVGKKNVFSFPTEIEFDNDASDGYSLIEIECLDQPFLLYHLSQKLFREGLFLASARVATYGERVVGAFYVQDGVGQKVVDREKQKHIKEQLLLASNSL